MPTVVDGRSKVGGEIARKRKLDDEQKIKKWKERRVLRNQPEGSMSGLLRLGVLRGTSELKAKPVRIKQENCNRNETSNETRSNVVLAVFDDEQKP